MSKLEILTLSFDLYDKQEHMKCLGLWIRAQNFAHIAPARSNTTQPSGRTSQLVSAVHSIRGLSAQVVLTIIPVLSVELRAPLKAVIFVPQAKPPLQNQQRVCALPTPIKIDRLLPLLTRICCQSCFNVV